MRGAGPVAVAVLALALTACSSTAPGPGDRPGDATASATPKNPPSPVLPSDGAEETPRSAPARQPVLLVTHATRTPPTLTRAQARRVLAGAVSAWRVVAAPRMPVGPDVPVLASARAVLRTVERDRGSLGVLPARAAGPTVRAATVAGVDPWRDPAGYPLLTRGPQPPVEPTTLNLVGDVMLARGVPDPAAALRPLSPLLRSADLTVGNLESTLSRAGPPQQGDDSFGADPAVLGPLTRAGFDALSLANNHTGDYADRALVQTVQRLRRSPIAPFGAGADLREAGRAAVLRSNGTSFGFVGFNAIGETPAAGPGTPGALSVSMPPRTGPLDLGELRRVAGLVRRLAARVDVVVVMPHWGTQYTHAPEPVQRLVSRRLVDAGADLVAGSHPHWVQGLDAYRGGIVAHSLGNFIFDMDFMTQTLQGIVLRTVFWGDRLVSLDLVPFRMDDAFAPRRAGPRQAADILGDVWSTSTGPFSAG